MAIPIWARDYLGHNHKGPDAILTFYRDILYSSRGTGKLDLTFKGFTLPPIEIGLLSGLAVAPWP